MKLHVHSVLVPPPELLLTGTKPEGNEGVLEQADLIGMVTGAIQAVLDTDALKRGAVYTLLIQSAEHKDGLVNVRILPDITPGPRGALN